MNCKECLELLPDYVFSTLSQRECRRLQEHLDGGCESCRQELGELSSAASMLAEDLEPVAPRPQVKDALFERIAKEASPRNTSAGADRGAPSVATRVSASNTEHPRNNWRVFIPYAAAAVVTLVLGSWVASVVDETSQLERQVLQARIDEWHERMAHANQVFGPPPQTLNTLKSHKADDSVHMVLFHDLLTRQLHVTAFDVPAPRKDRTYYLWLLDKHGAKLASSPLEYLAGGQAAGLLELEAKPEYISELLITEEPAGEVKSPSMDSVITRSSMSDR